MPICETPMNTADSTSSAATSCPRDSCPWITSQPPRPSSAALASA
jgi:hypothetical protein